MRLTVAIVLLAIGNLNPAALGQTQDVVSALLPEGAVRRLVMPKPPEKEKVIHQLKAAQVTAQGERAQQVAFLLAALGADYERNRDYLLWVMKGCEVPEIKQGCSDMTGEYLAYLYQHGHPEILGPLMSATVNDYNAAGAEFLGGFLADLVVGSPNDFLDAVRSFPASTQQKICSLAGVADGGGMAPAALRKVRNQLGRMNDELARCCLLQIEQANKPKH
jgi:hypothetical protein